MVKAPAFQFYPRDFVSDPKVAAMTNAEVGIYIRLLCYAWLDEGLPHDFEALARMVGETLPSFEKAWKRIGPCFEIVGDRIIQPRLERTRIEQSEYRERRSQAGKSGALGRWQSHTERKAGPLPTQGARKAMVMPENGSASATASAITSSLRDSAVESNDSTDAAARASEPEPVLGIESSDENTKRGPALRVRPPLPIDLPVELPPNVETLKAVALPFLATFANTKEPNAVRKALPACVEVLSQMRARGCSTSEAWDAFSDALCVNDGLPLFGGSVKKAMSYLPSRPSLRIVPTRDLERSGPYAGVPQTIAAEDRR